MVDQELLQAISTMMDQKLAPLNDRMDRLEQTVMEIKVTQEVRVLPGIGLLAEGHENILEHIDDKITDRTEDLQDQVDALTITVKQHSRDIRELKKAQ